MKRKSDTVAETGLQFFGKMTASISHEIKNVLAIINENAGLLEDFTLMADRGMPIDSGRLKKLSRSVMDQIRRADTIVKNLNRFAHSADDAFKSVDVNDTLGLTVVLSHRFASMRSVVLDLTLSETPVPISTRPFWLMNLNWRCLDFAMDATGESKTVAISAQKTAGGAQIRFGRLEGLTQASADAFLAQRDALLLDLLGAELQVNPANHELVIALAADAGGVLA